MSADFYDKIRKLTRTFEAYDNKLSLQDKMDMPKFCLTHIESLFGALSLTINDPVERQSFDTMFMNWRNDRLAEF